MTLSNDRQRPNGSRRPTLRLLGFFILALLLHGALLGADLWQNPRRSRKPIAVAMVHSPNKRPPTPEVLPLPRPAKSTTTKAPKLKRQTDRAKARKADTKTPREAEKIAKKGQKKARQNRPKNSTDDDNKNFGDAGTREAGPQQEAADAGRAEGADAAKAPPLQDPVVAQAGGMRSCAADGPGAALSKPVKMARAPKSQFPVTMLAAFRTRPDLGPYLSSVTYLGRVGPRALGAFRVALPDEVMRWELESPKGAAIYVGRSDARCAVVVTVKRNPTLMRVRGLPVRLVDGAQRVAAAIVDIEINDRMEISLRHREGAPLPFSKARLANSAVVSAALASHLGWARMMGR